MNINNHHLLNLKNFRVTVNLKSFSLDKYQVDLILKQMMDYFVKCCLIAENIGIFYNQVG